jgi:NAD(P)-dependent dehydrogenase (short-subunit alcohol dehydrogenase family)
VKTALLERTLEGRVALVTGAGRGIGKAVALEFARRGASVVIASRTRSELELVSGCCRWLGSPCEPVPADVGRFQDVRRLVATALRRFGRIDVLVNAAAVLGPIGRLLETRPEDWESTLRINLMGTVNTCRGVLEPMLQAGSGSIVNFSGGGATSALPNLSAYAASKAAVVRFSETLAEEVRSSGVNVFAVAPGMVNTTLHDRVLESGERAGPQYQRSAELRRAPGGGVPLGLVARLVLFLITERATGLSGRLISANHDPWQRWEGSGVEGVEGTPWYTLRRIDPHTLGALTGSGP